MPRLALLATTLLCATSAAAAYSPAGTGTRPTPGMAKASAVKLRTALEESREVTRRLGVCFSNSLASDDLPSAVIVPLLIVQRAVVVLVQALFSVFSAFDVAKNIVPNVQRRHQARVFAPRERLMPKQKGSLDMWLNQYQRTRELCTRDTATSTTVETPAATAPPPAPIATPSRPPNQAPIQLAGDAALAMQPPPAPQQPQSPQAKVVAVNARTAVSVTAEPNSAAPPPQSLANYKPSKSIWQEQGLAGSAAAKRKADAVDSFFAQFQRHRLGGRR